MRFLTCGADGILVELADLDETLRVFAALQSAVKHAVEQTAESPERAAQPSTTSVFAGVKQLIPAARTVYVAFDPLLSSRVELTAAIRALNVAADMERHSRIVEIPVIYDGEDMADVADLRASPLTRLCAGIAIPPGPWRSSASRPVSHT